MLYNFGNCPRSDECMSCDEACGLYFTGDVVGICLALNPDPCRGYSEDRVGLTIWWCDETRERCERAPIGVGSHSHVLVATARVLGALIMYRGWPLLAGQRSLVRF